MIIAEQRKTRGIIRRGTRALQPLAFDVLYGTLYYVTDEGVIERSNRIAWESFSAGATLPIAQIDVTNLVTDLSNKAALVHTHTYPNILGSASVNITYSASNFTANAGGTWTVDAGDQSLLSYARISNSMVVVQYAINTTTISGSPSLLFIQMPFVTTAVSIGLGRFYNGSSGVAEVIEGQIAGSSNSLIILRFDGSVWPTLTNLAYISGTILMFA